MAPTVSEIRALIAPAELSRQLGLSVQALAVMRMQGRGIRFIKISNRVMYRQSDVDEWIEAQTRTSTSDRGPRAPERAHRTRTARER